MDSDLSCNLTVAVIYVDGSMVQLETLFTSRHWRARATAYTQFRDIAAFASRLARFAETLTGTALFEAGREESPIGFLSLRFYPMGRTGHFACQLKLAADAATEYRPEEIWRVTVELMSEAAALDTFVAGLRRIADVKAGRAVLRLSE